MFYEWQPDHFLTPTIEGELLSIVEWFQKEELIKNLESWNDLFSNPHNRFLLNRELSKLWITL